MSSKNPDYDLVALGGGTAGMVIGIFGAQLGARVAIVEADRLGGECTWTGCVPSKALIASANVAATTGRTEKYGLPPAGFQGEINLEHVLDRMRVLRRRIYEDSDSEERLRELGVDVIQGRGRFVSPYELSVNGRTITARHFCIATGAHATIPGIDGFDRVPYLTSEDVFELRELPRRVLVIGGGPIGLELGQALSRLGSIVTVAEMAPQVLPLEDAQIADQLCDRLQEEGITVLTGTTVSAVRSNGEVTVVSKGSTTRIDVDAILVAAGQAPNVDGYGLQVAGVAYEPSRGITVDRYLRTTNKRIYAAGSVVGRYRLTHMAAYEVQIVLRNALFPLHVKADYAITPWATFTDPDVARVGLTTEEARERFAGSKVAVFDHPFARVDRAIVDGRDVGMVKIVCTGRRGRIVGAHIVGPSVGELIHECVLAMKKKMTKFELAEMIHVYPTLSEGPRTPRWHTLSSKSHPDSSARLLGCVCVWSGHSTAAGGGVSAEQRTNIASKATGAISPSPEQLRKPGDPQSPGRWDLPVRAYDTRR